MNIRMDEDPFARNAQGISKIYHEVLLLLKFSQTKPQVKNLNTKFYDLYYTVLKNRDETEIVIDKYTNNENDNNKIDDFITPNHNISIKPREAKLR